MIQQGCIDSEDGILLFGDAAILQSWRGADEETKAANAIEKALLRGMDGLIVSIKRQTSMAWNIEGPGTIDVFNNPAGNMVLIRCWCEDDENNHEIESLAALPVSKDGNALGDFRLNSGYLALLWTGESGTCIVRTAHGEFVLDTEEMMAATSGLIIPLANGVYRCIHDKVSSTKAEARRCHIFRIE